MTVTTSGRHPRPQPRVILGGTAAAVLLAGGCTVALAVANGGFDSTSGASGKTCSAPALAGAVVDATLVDTRGMGMMNGGQRHWRTWHAGMMRIAAVPSTIRPGIVSVRVHNSGAIAHELVVLPLSGIQAPGTRTVGEDGKVSESGSLGEVSATCRAGAGSGLTAGSTGWATLRLPAGRYELICNLPGHYTAGMYTELDVNT